MLVGILVEKVFKARGQCRGHSEIKITLRVTRTRYISVAVFQ